MKVSHPFFSPPAIPFVVFFLIFAAISDTAFGADSINLQEISSQPVVLILMLAGLSLVPFVLMTSTSFVKISVVLNILKSALGAQQIPPPSVISAISIILTIYVMYPVIQQCRKEAGSIIAQKVEGDVLTRENAARLIGAVNAAKEPLRMFLYRNSSPSVLKLFRKMAQDRVKGADGKKAETVGEKDFIVVMPSFLITELKEAFFIGFIIYLPFLIIELVISNILLSLGMHMLSPSTISLPFKLLLFIAVGGWEVISNGLILGYS